MRLLLSLLLALVVVAPLQAQRKSGGGSSWSGGSSSKPSGSKSSWSGGSSKPTPAPSRSTPSPSKPAPAPAPAGKSSWSGGSSGTGKSGWSGGGSNSTPPKAVLPVKFDQLARQDAVKAESRANYAKSQTPKREYKTPTGKTVPLDTKDPQLDRLRRDLDHDKWVQRPQRETQFYRRYTQVPTYTTVVYNDPFHSDLHWYLNSLPVETMALFLYHHQAQLDAARLQMLYERNITLQSKVAALQWQALPRDPAYVPPGAERDLLYNDAYVDAVYNPELANPDPGPPPTPINWGRFWSGVWWLIRWLFYCAVMVAVPYGLYWLTFKYRW